MSVKIHDNLIDRLQDSEERPVSAAPLAGWTDRAYRSVLKKCGVRHIWIPFVSSHAVANAKSPNRDAYLREVMSEGGHVQIFAANPDVNAKAAKILEDCGAQTIDFNAGCSVKKVHKGGGGSALLKDIDLLTENLRAVKEAVSIPVSLKTRIGFYRDSERTGIEACRRAEDIGFSWVTLHGRYAKQGFGGTVEVEAIAELVGLLSIPVIGNGDICTPSDVVDMFEKTGCAGVMIGRAIMGDPWLISDTEDYIAGGVQRQSRTRSDMVGVMLDHQEALLEQFPDRRGVWEFRKHVSKYLRGFAQASVVRNLLVREDDADEVRRILKEFGEGRPPSRIGDQSED